MDFTSSKLGTQEYWDDFYKLEIKNFETHSDVGECWFDDCGAEDRMVDFILNDLSENFTPNSKVLDLGTGNGHLLFSLLELNCEFLGIDYSPQSIKFAQEIALKNNYEVKFKQVDFINNTTWNNNEKFDLVLDKGTLDAIALSNTPNALEKYVLNLKNLLHKTSLFMITSCNFTKDELIKLIKLNLVNEIEYPTFEFGGKKGSPVVTLVFQP